MPKTFRFLEKKVFSRVNMLIRRLTTSSLSLFSFSLKQQHQYNIIYSSKRYINNNMSSTTTEPETYPIYPIGTPGIPWGDAEKKEWLSKQTKIRDYFGDILSPFMRLDFLEIFQYGELDYRKYGSALFPLFAGRSKNWNPELPLVLISSGNHGYELTFGGHLLFLKKYWKEFEGKANFLCIPCLSPWGFEVDHRWTPLAVDPNRTYTPSKPGSDEAKFAMALTAEYEKKCKGILAHFDLHETTLTDNSIFEPAKIARDGLTNKRWEPVPIGFYLVDNDYNTQPAFQKACIDAVRPITKIAAADEKGEIIGEKVYQEGVILIASRSWGLCGGFSNAPYSTTTEVFPDAPGCTREECDIAQCECIVGGLRYALANPLPPLAPW